MTFVPECPNKRNFPSVFTPAQVSQLYCITGAEEMISVPSVKNQIRHNMLFGLYTRDDTQDHKGVFCSLHSGERIKTERLHNISTIPSNSNI